MKSNQEFLIKIFLPIFAVLMGIFFITSYAYSGEADCRQDISLWINELRNNAGNYVEAVDNIKSKTKECKLDLEKDFGITPEQLTEMEKIGCLTNIRMIVKSLNERILDYERDTLVNLLREELIRSKLPLSSFLQGKELKDSRKTIIKALKKVLFQNKKEEADFLKMLE